MGRLELDELGARDPRCQEPPLGDRAHLVVASMDHEGRGADGTPGARRARDGARQRRCRRQLPARCEERERSGKRGRLDHALEVLHPTLERDVAGLPIGHATAALVIADVAEMVREELHPMPPDRARPVVLEVRQPARRPDQGGTRARLGPGELDAVRGAEVADRLAGHSSGGGYGHSSRIGTSFPSRAARGGRILSVSRRALCAGTGESMLKRVAFLVYGVACYMVFLGTFLLCRRLHRRLRGADDARRRAEPPDRHRGGRRRAARALRRSARRHGAQLDQEALDPARAVAGGP